MADLVNEAISWLQNGEPITGGSGGDSVGVLNRPLVQLLANDNGLQDRIDIIADDDGYLKKVISSIKVTETDVATTARVQIDATGLKQYDGTNICVDLDESGNATIGYGANDKITLVAGVLTVKTNELDITGAGNSGISLENATGDALSIAGAGANAIEVEAATEYGLKLGNCTSGYGPLHIVNAGVTGASNLHTTYGSAEVDTLAIDDQHDLFIKTGASTWQKVGATASPVAVVDTATITGTATTDNSVVIDANGLTMRKAAGAVRFDVNEDGSFTLGNAAGERIDFTTGDALTFTNGTLTSPKINEAVALTATATELNLLDGVSGLIQADFTKLAGINSASAEDLDATTNFEETISATTSEVSVLTSKNLNVVGHDGATYGLKLNNTLVTATAVEINLLDGVNATTAELNYLDNDDLIAADFTKLAGINSASAEDLDATTNFEETISATTSVVTIAAAKDLNIAGHDGVSNGLKLNNVLVTATAADLNAMTPNAIVGSGSGHKVKSLVLRVEEGTTSGIKCSVSNMYNGDTIASADNLGKSGTVGYWSLSSDGKYVTIDADAFTGDIVGVLCSSMQHNSNATTVDLISHTYLDGVNGHMYFGVLEHNSGVKTDLTTLMTNATHRIEIHAAYITGG